MILQYVSGYNIYDAFGAGPEGEVSGDGGINRTYALWGDGLSFGDGHGSSTPHHTNMFEEGDGEGIGDDVPLLEMCVSQMYLLMQVLNLGE